MDGLHALVLAALQGLTEFLPISSSAHLILLPRLVGWPDQGLAFDVAVHVGSLSAVVTYFRRQIRDLARAWWRRITAGERSADSALAQAILFASIPVAVAGALFSRQIETVLREPMVIATTTLSFGLLLGWADRASAHRRDERSLGWKDIAVIGCAQALALVPGTSRAGITMTAGLGLGLTRAAAARFSFLLAIPVILLAGGHHVAQLVASPEPVPWSAIAIGVCASGVTAFLCIHFFLRLVERVGLMPFVVYRVILALVLFAVYWPDS